MSCKNLMMGWWMIVGLAGALAQTAQTKPPASPLLHRAPAFAAWTINYKYKDQAGNLASAQPANSAGGDRINLVSITKTNKTYCDLTEWSSGKKTESWMFENTYLQMSADGKSIVPYSFPFVPSYPGETLDIFAFGQSDFEGFQWIAIGNYKGVENFRGMAVYRFEMAVSGAPAKGLNPVSSGKVALLAVDTQLPVFLDDGEIEQTFSFGTPPSAPLVPPKNFLDVLKKMKQGEAYRRSRPSPP